MYKVFCDGETIYHPQLEKRQLFDATLELELNKTGTFSFTIYPQNVEKYGNEKYDKLRKMRSIIEVKQDDDLVFRGRILDEEQGFYNAKQVTCEGELAFLLDSVIDPHGSDDIPETYHPTAYLDKLIDGHNAMMGDDTVKHFKRGDVSPSLEEKEISVGEEDYKSPWELITDNLIDNIGGYIWVSHKEDGTYLNYLDELDVPSNQAIKLRKNLLDIRKTVKGADYMTGILPVGKDGNDTTVTIESVNDGKNYLIDEEAAKVNGRIIKVVEFEASTPEELKDLADEYLKNASKFTTSVELTAADVSGIEEGVNPFRLGQKLAVEDDYHGLKELAEGAGDELLFLVKKLSVNILQPSSNKLVVGATFSTMTEQQNASVSSQKKAAQTISKIEKKSSTYATRADLEGYCTKEEAELQHTALDKKIDELEKFDPTQYYTNSSVDALVSGLQTQITALQDRVALLEGTDTTE